MTEKERLLRALLYEAAFFVQLHKVEAGEMNEQVIYLDERITQALADTEDEVDTGGVIEFKEPLITGYIRQMLDTKEQAIRDKLIALGWTPPNASPPKEQDDEAIRRLETIISILFACLPENSRPKSGNIDDAKFRGKDMDYWVDLDTKYGQ